MHITSKGQVTIPKHYRESLGFLPDSEVEFVAKGKVLELRRIKAGKQSRGSKLIDLMKGKAQIKMSTDDIMALTRGEN